MAAGARPDPTLLFIDGEWTEPQGKERIDLVDPATEEVYGEVAVADSRDVDRAVQAARRAFESFSATSPSERRDLLVRIIEVLENRRQELIEAVSQEMGAPVVFADRVHVERPLGHLRTMVDVLADYAFEDPFGARALLRREAIGVAGLITAWNWPLSLLMSKLVAALGAGCTTVVKPSEMAPLSATVLATMLEEAGVPAGVFNLVHGDGPRVGEAIASHPDIDAISFTGSTRAGVAVSRAAAPTVKRVVLELGGKSPNVILPDADLDDAVYRGVMRCFINTGQSCQAPTRMLVHESQHDDAMKVIERAVGDVVIGDPRDPATTMGPLANRKQFDKVQEMIRRGEREGARLVTGGTGRPEDLDIGLYVRPTVFTDVSSKMTIAQEEIFGPVLVVLTYGSDDEAVAIANDTTYGLSAYVESGDLVRARNIARRIRAGRVYLNGAAPEPGAPFGGYGHSGNGREGGRFGMEQFTEMKAILGYREG